MRKSGQRIPTVNRAVRENPLNAFFVQSAADNRVVVNVFIIIKVDEAVLQNR
jgi:hypothetical protein